MEKNKIKKILVPLDGSKNSFRALDNAIYFAKENKAVLTGIFVVQISPSEIDALRGLIKKALHKQYSNFMTKAKSIATKKGVPFYDQIEYGGNEGPEIISYAEKNNFDLIVIGSRGNTSVKEFFLGSTSNYVMHNSSIPVLIVK